MSPAVCSSTVGRCLQVDEGVFTGFGGEGEQVGSQGWPGGFGGEPRRYRSAWSSSATAWGPRSCSAATWRPSV